MKKFTAEELKITGIILIVLITISLINFRNALRLGRDADRKTALGEVHNALNQYQNDFGFFPPSSPDGKIVACRKEGVDYEKGFIESTTKNRAEFLAEIFAPCEWGKDSLADVTDPGYPSYISPLPQAPYAKKGEGFFYASNTGIFQLYGALEGKSEDEYDEGIEALGIPCGERICNFGKATGKVPLDKTLEEYENERSTK